MSVKLCRVSLRGAFPQHKQVTGFLVDCVRFSVMWCVCVCACCLAHRRLKDPEAHQIPDGFVELWQDAVKTNAKASF